MMGTFTWQISQSRGHTVRHATAYSTARRQQKAVEKEEAASTPLFADSIQEEGLVQK